MRRSGFPALASVLLLNILLTASWAQTTQGGIVGTVQDQKGAAVAGAKITVISAATGLQRDVSSADNGIYRVIAIPSGMYEVRAEAPGFASLVEKDIEIGVAQTRTLDLVLKVGATAETVTVEANADLTQTESSKLGQIIDNRKVEDLPLNGRDFAQLARLNPGVAVSGGGGGQQGGEGNVSGFSSNGQRSTSNNFLVDGVDNNNYFAGEAAQLPSVDSIQEFEVQTNTFAAEYGRNTGSVINLVTKSGTNQLHGSAYEFFRNDVFDARNFFNQDQFPKSGLHLNQFGGTLGGPIVKNNTFFFLNYEGFRRKAGITRITNVPTLDQRAGTFTDASGNPVTIAVNPVSAQLFKLYPDPNLNNPSGNFISSPEQSDATDQFLVKVDHRLRSSDSLSARYSRTRSDIFFPFTPGQSGTNVPGYGVNDNGANHLVAISYTRVISPRTLNEARLGFTRTNVQLATQTGPQAADFGINTGWPAGHRWGWEIFLNFLSPADSSPVAHPSATWAGRLINPTAPRLTPTRWWITFPTPRPDMCSKWGQISAIHNSTGFTIWPLAARSVSAAPITRREFPTRWSILPRDSPAALCSSSATLTATSTQLVMVSSRRTVSSCGRT